MSVDALPVLLLLLLLPVRWGFVGILRNRVTGSIPRGVMNSCNTREGSGFAFADPDNPGPPILGIGVRAVMTVYSGQQGFRRTCFDSTGRVGRIWEPVKMTLEETCRGGCSKCELLEEHDSEAETDPRCDDVVATKSSGPSSNQRDLSDGRTRSESCRDSVLKTTVRRNDKRSGIGAVRISQDPLHKPLR